MMRLLFVLLLVFVAHVLPAQRQSLKFEHINIEDGLSQSFVTSILQDRRGFMWFGTSDGLNRYDGYRFTVFKNEENKTNSLSHNQVNDILEDSDGALWAATWNGLNLFDRSKERFTNFNYQNHPGALVSDYVQCLFEDSQGRLWIGTFGGGRNKAGLSLFDKSSKSFTHYPVYQSDTLTSGHGVSAIFEDSRQNLWIGSTNDGVKLFDPEKGKVIPRVNAGDDRLLQKAHITAIFEDARGALWVGARDAGLFYLDQKTGAFRRFEGDDQGNDLPGQSVLSLGQDSRGNLWIGMDNAGLAILSPHAKTLNTFAHDPGNPAGLNNNSIYSIYRDDKGNMWLGSYSGGVNFFNSDGNRFTHFRTTPSPNSLNNNTIFCIREDSRGNLLIATDGGGLNIFDRKNRSFTHLMHEDGDPNTICGNNVLAALEDRRGNIWIGTWGRGISVYNPNKNILRHYRHNPGAPRSLSSDNVWTIFEDSKNNIWIGTYNGGLNLYDPDRDDFTHFKLNADSNCINSNVINCIYEDSDGYLWIGTVNGGLDRFDPKENYFKHYVKDSSGISSNLVTNVLEASNGDLWIATASGLNRLNRSTDEFTVYNVSDGLPHNFVRAILEDSRGYLWVSTNGGLARFDVENEEFKNFTVSDGLQASEFKTHAAFKSSDGLMYFGGVNGFNEFHPDSINSERYDPAVVFTDLLVFNQSLSIADDDDGQSPLKTSISEAKEITLPYNQSVISFEFAVLNYTANQKKQYAYMLEGFDKSWNYVTDKRSATYTNLDPGKYVMKAMGSNNTGGWSSKTAELTLVITPPYWKTWWFRILVAIAFSAGIVGFYRYRVNAIRRQKDELEFLVKERTGELSRANKAIIKHQSALEKLYNEMKDSIRAAEVIQNSILPPDDFIRKHLPEYFVFYKPKDVVSGDFYWLDEKNGKVIVAVADCTGHGVSGAFMTINGYHLLTRVLNRHDDPAASDILNEVNKHLVNDLHAREHQNGMDIALCILDFQKSLLQYAGAGCPLYIIRKGELIQVKGARFGMGIAIGGRTIEFTDQEICLEKGDTVYMFTDGFTDQLGGEDFEKYMYPRFRKTLLKISREKIAKQAQLLEEEIDNWRGKNEQLDDMLIMGFKI